MDPRFRRNHQLHLLLKRRTYVSDHELYEMMRSKQVFRAQNELRRELERRLQEINLDQKVKVASYMVQKATFLKMMAAREKGRRHLLNVKKHMGKELVETMYAVLNENHQEDKQFYDENGLEVSTESVDINDILNLSDLTNPLTERQNSRFSQSVNNEWMEDISKGGVTLKDKSKQKGKSPVSMRRILDKRMPKEKERTEYSSKENFAKAKITQLTSLESITNENIEKQLSRKDKKHATEDIIVHEMHPNVETRSCIPTEDKANPHEATRHEDIAITLPDIHLKSHQHLKSHPNSKKGPNPLHCPHQILLEPLPPIPSNRQSKTLLDVPSAAPRPKAIEPQERERSVTMLFVEESDDYDDDLYVTEVSPFDIEAFNKWYKRPRGYSIIISSTDLTQYQEREQCEDTETKKKRVKKSKISSKYSQHPSSWGVKTLDEISPRQRSNQWYQNFMKTKKSKKLHNDKTTKQKSRNLEGRHAVHEYYDQCHGEDEMPVWKTTSSSDSHVSQELLCQLKLQRLKQHCQSLSQRVALFVSSK